MLQKDQEEPQEPRQSGSFKALQEFIDSDGELFLFPRQFPPQHKNILQDLMINDCTDKYLYVCWETKRQTASL